MANGQKLERNLALLCVFQALLAALFPVAIMPLFWSRELGMNWTTIMSVQAFFSLVAAVCEVPSGYLADRLGYRRSLLLASLIITLGWAIYAAASGLGTLLLAEALHGIGFSLISGADTALLFESLKHHGREGEFPRWYARMRFWGQISEGTAALSAGFLYAWWARLPFVLEVVLWVAASIVVLKLVETPERARISNHWAKVKSVARYVAIAQPELRGVLFTSAVFGILAYIPVWQIGIYAENSGISRAWLGPIWAAANYTVAIGGALATRAKERLGLTPLLFGALGAIALGYLGLGLSHAAFGFAFYYLTTLARGAVMIPLHHAEQQLSPSEDRATIVSIRALIFRLSVVCVMPLVGHLVDRFGQRFTFLVASAPLLFMAAFCVLWLRGLTRRTSLKLALSEQ
ncbi:MAG: MFS transporter [Polyangiaceae bacterium]|nr:MFS transporter [Polyangiaceae bacterium]